MSLLYLFDFVKKKKKSEFGRHILAEIPDIKFHAIRPAGAKLFHANKWTDITKLNVAFRHISATAHKNCPSLLQEVGVYSLPYNYILSKKIYIY